MRNRSQMFLSDQMCFSKFANFIWLANWFFQILHIWKDWQKKEMLTAGEIISLGSQNRCNANTGTILTTWTTSKPKTTIRHGSSSRKQSQNCKILTHFGGHLCNNDWFYLSTFMRWNHSFKLIVLIIVSKMQYFFLVKLPFSKPRGLQ
jgi:hypothetical protein